MKNGQQIDVADMDDNHVQNTINMIMRNNTPRNLLNAILLGVQKAREIDNKHSNRDIEPQGDMAREFNRTFDHDIHDDIYPYDQYWD